MANRRRPKGTGGVTKRQDGLFQATHRYRDANDCSKVKTFYGKTQKEALDKKRDWIAKGGELTKGDHTVDWLFDYLLREKDGYFVQQRRQKENTLYDYRSQYQRHVKPRIGHVRLSRLNVGHLDSIPLAMINDPEKPTTGKTAKNVQNLIRMCVSEGQRQGYVSSTLHLQLTPIATTKYRASLIGLPEMVQLVEASLGKRSQTAILLAGFCGLRESEIAGLMWSDFDEDEGTLRIGRQFQHKKGGGTQFDDPKTEAGFRRIPLPAVVLDHLKALSPTSLYVLPSAKDPNRPVHPTTLYHEARTAMDAAGIKKVRFHDLRHSANNILKQLGVDSVTRRDILGHSTTAVTDNIYTQTVDAEMVAAMGRLNDAISLRSR